MGNTEERVSPLVEWAREEIRLAKLRDMNDKDEEDKTSVEYASKCYDAALEAFETLCGQGHSGLSIRVTQSILNHLIDIKPLTPLTGDDDEWGESIRDENKPKTYQNKRYSALFKYVDDNGEVTYSDNDYFFIKALTRGGDYNNYTGGIASIIVKGEKFLPEIKFPYMPTNKPFKVFVVENEYADVIFIDKITGGSFNEPKIVGKFYKYDLKVAEDGGSTYEEISEEEAKKIVEESSDQMKSED